MSGDVKVTGKSCDASTIKMEQALGFSLYMMRAVLQWRGDEVMIGRNEPAQPLNTPRRSRSGDQQLFIPELSDNYG